MGALKLAKSSKSKRSTPLARARAAHQCAPKDQAALLTLSDLLEANGQWKQAAKHWRSFLDAEPDHNAARLNYATLLFRQSHHKDAYEQFALIGDFDPFSAQSHNGAGACCFAMREFDLAIAHYSKAISLNHRSHPFYVNLAHALAAVEKFSDAVDATRLAHSVAVNDASILAKGADLLLKHEAFEEAISLYRDYLELVPTNAQAACNLGSCYRAIGAFQEAETAFLMATRLDPENPTFLYNLSTVAKAPTILGCCKGTSYKAENAMQQASYHFAMGSALDEMQDYEGAFEHFEKANAALYREVPSTGKIERFGLKLAQNNTPIAHSPTPIFVIGMPRSGTTLTERILSAHSKVTAGGERSWLRNALQYALLDEDSAPKSRAFHIAERYCAQIPASLKSREYLIDKMPLNFRFVKEALLAFPKAKFVHVHRDQRAVAWSNYRTFFTRGGSSMSFTTHRGKIATFLANYRAEVASWEELPQERIVHLDYEALVRRPELATRDLITALDLPFEEGLSKEAAKGSAIRTASAVQARMKVYRGSSEEWKNYEPFAQEWFEALSRGTLKASR